MKKQLIGITLATLIVSMFAFTGSVFAQAEVPPEVPADTEPVTGETLYLYHDENIAALVDMTGLSAEEIEARLAAGETAYDIAISMDVTQEDFHAIWPMGGAGMQGDGECDGICDGSGSEDALQTRLRIRVQDGSCMSLEDCEPKQLNDTCEPIALEDGTGAGNRGGNSNR
jgi:hypothetical protein